jgi:hypothetical protein
MPIQIILAHEYAKIKGYVMLVEASCHKPSLWTQAMSTIIPGKYSHLVFVRLSDKKSILQQAWSAGTQREKLLADIFPFHMRFSHPII